MENKYRSRSWEAYFEKNAVAILYKRLLINVFSTLVTLGMLTGFTYAWFTATALTNKNTMKTGILAVDLLLSESELKDVLAKESGKEPEDITIDDSYKEYIRKIGDTPETHYIVTDTDTALITFENAEPGQIYPVKFKVANTGQLALTYTPTFEIAVDEDGKEMSFTGLETLNREREASEEYLSEIEVTGGFTEGDYTHDEDLAEEGLLTNRDYEIRYRVLMNEQWDIYENLDSGGHLESILKVYNCEDKDEISDDNFLGTVDNIINNNTISGHIPDYQGYLLPYAVVKDYIDDGGLDVTITDGTDVIEEKPDVTEVGEISFLIKIPENTDNLYEYASLTLRVGVRATQVEYEKDGLEIMIYDKGAHTPPEPADAV